MKKLQQNAMWMVDPVVFAREALKFKLDAAQERVLGAHANA